MVGQSSPNPPSKKRIFLPRTLFANTATQPTWAKKNEMREIIKNIKTTRKLTVGEGPLENGWPSYFLAGNVSKHEFGTGYNHDKICDHSDIVVS